MGLLNSPILEVTIGIIFTYLIFGLLCTSINEIVAQAFSLRAETLWGAIRSLLHDPPGTGAAADLYNHFLIRPLAVRNANQPDAGGDDPNNRAKPSYIPAHLFSLALVDMIANPSGTQSVAPDTKTLLDKLPDSGFPAEVKAALTPLVQAADGSIDRARANIEQWYDDTMDRASGWYKQKVQRIILFIAVLIVFVANGDTLMLANQLWANPSERAAIVAAAQKQPAPSSGTGTTNVQVPPALQNVIGWSGPVLPSIQGYNPTDPRRFPSNLGEWLVKIIGLLLTAFAASLGAPFWFDMLNKIINIRATGSPPEEASKRPGATPKERIPSSAGADQPQ